MQLESFNLARMLQRFASKKKSVGYSHPPILKNEKAIFRAYDHTGRVFVVTVQEWSCDQQQDGVQWDDL